MPRTPQQTPSPAPADDGGLVGAAISFPGKGGRSRPSTGQDAWQREVWQRYDDVGEFRYGLSWSANVTSRAVLRAAHRHPTGEIKHYPLDHPASKALAYLSGGIDGQPVMLRNIALHLSAVGECYLVDRPTRPADDPLKHNLHATGGRMWEVVGTEEINNAGTSWWIQYENGEQFDLTEKDTVIRIWQRHPRNRFLADSASKAALPILREIRKFDLHIEAQTDSRLSSVGLFLLPSEMQVKPPSGVNPSITTADIVVKSLVEAATASKVGLGTAEAQVPIVMTGPGDVIKNAKHIQFWSPLDDKAGSMRTDALQRLATTLDLPQEIITGTSGMNRWGAWQVEESSVKAHVEPLLSVIVAALTTEYLQPITGDENDLVVYDTSTLRLRPNRSKEAIELYDRGQLSAEALLRETGFAPGDEPTEDERKEWMLMQMVRASWSPQQAQAAASALGVDLGIPLPEDNAIRQARPTPSLQDHPVHSPPEQSVAEGNGFPVEHPEAAVAAMVAWRAMERAGNRLRTITGSKPDQPPENTHVSISVFPDRAEDLLRDSFDNCATFGLSASMVSRVHAMCRDYLIRGREFTYADARNRLGR